MKRYYSTQRPVGPGTYPRKDGRETVTNFNGGKIICEEIDKEAWGYIEYPAPISEEEAANYELTPAGDSGNVVECEKNIAILIKEENR